MGIFADLGFKRNSSGQLVAPNSAKVNGKSVAELQTELVNRVSSDIILSPDVDGVASFTNFTNVNKADFFGDGSNIATYFFDGDVKDARGSYNGTATAITYSTGKFGQCAVFNGSNSLNYSALPTSLKTYKCLVTISCWAKTTNSAGKQLFTIGDSTKFIYGMSCSNFGMNIDTGATSYVSATTSNTITDNIWHHYVGIYDGTTSYFYIDGILKATSSVANASYGGNGINGLNIGCLSTNYPASYFNGQIDNVRIFNRALTASEVTSLYNELIPSNILIQDTTQNNWYKYQATAYNLTAGAKLFINGSEQTGTSLSNNAPDFFGDGSNIATYFFEGNTNDARGTYNGTATGITYGTGKFGQCAVFNGTSSKIINSNLPISNSMTISFWMNKSSFVSGYEVYFTLGTDFTGNYKYLTIQRNNSNNFRFEYGSGGGSYVVPVTATTTISTDSLWHHYLVVFDKQIDKCIIYKDGVKEVCTTSIAGYSAAGGTGLNICASNLSTNMSYASGRFDNVRIFNRALTASEVTSLYNEGVVNFQAVSTNTRQLNLSITGGSTSKVDINLYTGVQA